MEDIAYIHNRTDAATDRLKNFVVFVSDTPFASTDITATRNQSGVTAFDIAEEAASPTRVMINRAGKYVRVQLKGRNYLSLAEVQVFTPAPSPAPAVARSFVSDAAPTPSVDVLDLTVDAAATTEADSLKKRLARRVSGTVQIV